MGLQKHIKGKFPKKFIAQKAITGHSFVFFGKKTLFLCAVFCEGTMAADTRTPMPEDTPTPPAPPTGRTGLPEPALAAEAIQQMLLPMARLMIDHGLQLTPMVELLKKALVEEAVGAFGLADKGSSDTRIALLTGVHRKDVKRLRGQAPTADPTPPMVPVAASVVARWISEPRFLNADRSPRALARTPGKCLPGEPDFTALVAEVSRDVGARAVLDELQRLGVVGVDAEGQVHLKSNAFVPQEGLRESFHFLAANVTDHLAAAVHNLSPDRTAPPMLEQSAFSQDLTAHQSGELQQLARQAWGEALQRFLQAAAVAEQRSQSATEPKFKVRFGVYFQQTEQPAPEDIAPARPTKKSRRKQP